LFRYVLRFGSSTTPYGRVADPAVVCYTPLLVSGPHGRRYELRIRRDLDEGAPERWLDRTLLIAQRFGTERKIRPKVDRIHKERAGRE
jgi:hypothetical protein